MIELSKVSFRRGEQQILDGAFVRIDAGQVVLISGPSGIGKTSLLSLMGGFLSAEQGAVKVFERNVAKLRSTSTSLLRRKIAFVPQELELIDDLSALANVRIALEVSGVSRREAKKRSAAALAAMDLAEYIDEKVCNLSTGQRRRVCIARGLVRQAEIFVADEPSNDLDAERVLLFVELIEEMREGGSAVVIATNDPRLLAHAQQPAWRHLDLSMGQLVPGNMGALFTKKKERARTLDESIDDLPNVVPFPVSAAVGGVE